MENREPERGTGAWERVYSAKSPENSEWRAKEKKGNNKKCYGCKREFLFAVPPDDQYVLVTTNSDWYWDQGQRMKRRLGENQISILTGRRPSPGAFISHTSP